MIGKNIYVIAGPNGSGKTTFALKFLPYYAHCKTFVNADLIAQGLSPFALQNAALQAGKLVIKQIHVFTKTAIDFGFESTLSGRTYVNLFTDLKKKGYKIRIFFLWVPNFQIAAARIKERVYQGGHDIPSQDIKRRFKRSIDNFFSLYQPIVDSWMLFNNTDTIPVLIAKNENGKTFVIDDKTYRLICEGRAK